VFEKTGPFWQIGTAFRNVSHPGADYGLPTTANQLNLFAKFFGQELLYFVTIGHDIVFKGKSTVKYGPEFDCLLHYRTAVWTGYALFVATKCLKAQIRHLEQRRAYASMGIP
jgi:hypothetical protein